MAQIKDVAQQAGVSVASVSRVMAGHAGVSEATRQRVLDAVQALDYRPDLAARRLRSRRTDTIGLIVSDIRNPFFTEISRAVEDVAYQFRWCWSTAATARPPPTRWCWTTSIRPIA